MSKSEPKILVTLVTVGLIALAVALLPTVASARPTAQPRKACSAYSKEHFHGVTAHMPDGTKCLQSGEYCSHGAGFARAYREYGFVCQSDGRLEEV